MGKAQALVLKTTLYSHRFYNFSRTSPGTLARDLIDHNEPGRNIDVIVERRVKLEGPELEEFEKRQRLAKIEDVGKECVYHKHACLVLMNPLSGKIPPTQRATWKCR